MASEAGGGGLRRGRRPLRPLFGTRAGVQRPSGAAPDDRELRAIIARRFGGPSVLPLSRRQDLDLMRISLVNPHIPVFQRNYAFRKTRRWQPLSIAIVASWLEQRGGFDIQLLDAHVMDWDDVETARRVAEFGPDVLLYSSERTDAWELPIPDTSYIESFFRE